MERGCIAVAGVPGAQLLLFQLSPTAGTDRDKPNMLWSCKLQATTFRVTRLFEHYTAGAEKRRSWLHKKLIFP